VPFLAGSEEPSLTQNTDRNVLANFPIFLRERLIFKVLRCRQSFIVARHQAPTLIGC